MRELMNDPKYWHYEPLARGTKECPACGKQMITQMSNMTMTSNPPQRRWGWWCGGCAYEELGGIHVEESREDAEMRRWRAAQR